MSFVINQSREVTGKGYINVLDPDTNEVLAFPQTMSANDIDQAISDDKNGTITEPKPNWYNDKVRPVLEASKMDIFQPRFLGAKVEPDATRAFMSTYAKEATFGIIDATKAPVNLESQALHPIATFTGALAGQTQAILMTAGLGQAFGLGKAANATRVAVLEGGSAVEARVAAGMVSGAGVGALYGAMTESVREVNRAIEENDAPSLIKVGESALKDAGIFALYGGVGTGIPSKAVGTAAISGLAYTISKVEGASEQDALLSAGVMGLFHLSISQPKEAGANAVLALTKLKYDYIRATNPAIHEAIARRTAQEHTMMIEEQIKTEKQAYNDKLEEKQLQQMDNEGGAPVEKPVAVIATPREIIQRSVEEMLDVKPAKKAIKKDIAKDAAGKPIEIGKVEDAPKLKERLTPTERRNQIADSSLSYVTANGEKVHTTISNNELINIKDEVAKVPKQTDLVEQLHLDYTTKNLLKGSKEISREEFIKGHPQVKGMLDNIPEFKMPVKVSKAASDIAAKIKKVNIEEKQDLKIQREMESEGGVSKDIAEQAFKDLSVEEQAKYTPITKKDQLEKVGRLINSNYENAKLMALGKIPISGDVHSQVVFNAVKNKALFDMDIELLRDLANSPIATERSLAAQELSASGFDNGLKEGDPVAVIKEVQKVREVEVEKKLGKERIVREKSAEVKKIQKEIKAVVKKQDWAGFIKSLEC